MADFTLGRAGRATANGGDGIVLKLTESPTRDGDEVSVRGEVRGSEQASLGALRAAVAQLQGYGPQNTDEPRVPVTWAQDPSLDGFYEVISVDVGAEVSGRLSATADYRTLVVPFSAKLVRVTSFEAPLVEVRVVGGLRANDHSITDLRGWVGLPPSSVLIHGYQLAAGAGTDTGAGESHTGLVLFDNGIVPDEILRDDSVTFSTAPSDTYDAAAKIEVTYDSGSTWHVVTGRQVDNLPTAFRISNDRIRVTHSATNVFTFSGYLGGWESKNFQVTYNANSATSLGTPASLTVLRNSPECCIIRLWMSAAGAGKGAYLDLKVSRGAWWLDAALGSPTNVNTDFGVFRDASEAATDITGGIEATSADANGNKFQWYTPETVTTVTTGSSGFYSAGTAVLPFGISYNTLTSSTLSNVRAYFAAINHKQAITAR